MLETQSNEIEANDLVLHDLVPLNTNPDAINTLNI
jgi:hypothetical protein